VHYPITLPRSPGPSGARERIYVTEAWEAPEWRAPWRSATPADPPDEVTAGLSD
jgi:hypothetical protein